MTAIFISHRSTDNATAAALKDWLATQGHSRIFLDFDPVNGIPAGVDWERAIYQALRRCQAVIVVLTPDWLASRWCFAELALAREQGKPVFVARAGPTPGGPLIPALQEVDLTVDREDALAKLARGLKERGLDPRDAFDWKPDRPVYPGLAAFDEEDAAVFFGRGEESWRAVEALERLRRQGRGAPRLLLVTGASGSGKSSLMRAGVLPRLMKDPGHWLRVRPFRRGADPLDELSDALASTFAEHGGAQAAAGGLAGRLRAAAAAEPPDGACLREIARDLRRAAGRPDATVLLALDQAEELLAPDGGGNAHRLLHFLRAALAGADRELMAVATLRSDMLGLWQQHPGVRVAEGRPELAFEAFPLGLMPLDHVPEMVRGPARYVGLEVDDDALDAIRRDVETPDALPLLAYTLRRLHDRHGGDGRLTLRDYEKLGRLEGSIRSEADNAVKVDELSAEDREALRAAFVPMLVRATEGGGFARERALRERIPRRADPLIDRFVDARLLVADRDGAGRETVEVAHEALLRVWPSLAAWLAEDADGLRLLEGLRRAAEEWDLRGRRADLLVHRGRRLREAEEVLAEPRFAGRLDPRDVDYLKESRAAQRLQEEIERRQRNRIFVGGSIIIALFAVLAVVFFILRGEAEKQRDLARASATEALANETHALAALSEAASLQGQRADGLKLALASWPRHANDPRPMLERSLRAMGLATEGTAEPVQPLRHESPVVSAAFSADGRRLVTGSYDGTARLWDAATGAPIGQPIHHREGVNAAAFSPDGRRLVTASDDRTARLWDAAIGAAIGAPMQHDGAVLSAAFSPDGRRLVTASDDRTARLWDAAIGAPIGAPMQHNGAVLSAAFSPDGMRVVTASEEGTVRLWDLASGTPIGQPMRFDGTVLSAAFIRDGMRVVTASEDGTVQLWDAANGAPIGQPIRHERAVRSAAFSPDGMRVVTASDDRTARLWEAATGAPLGQPMRHKEAVMSAAFSADGGRLVTGSSDGAVRLWGATTTGAPMGPPMRHGEAVRSAGFSADGRRLVTASEDGTARLWDPATGAPIGQPMRHERAVRSAAFSPDGTWVVTASEDGTARLWDAATGASIGPLMRHEDGVWSAAFSPNGSWVVTASRDGTARLWDAATGAPIEPPMRPPGGAVRSAVFSPDGTRVVTASEEGSAQVWDAASGAPIGKPMNGQNEDWVWSAAFSPDGSWVVTASRGGMASLWDAANGAPIGEPMPHDGRVYTAVFSPDGTRVATASYDGTARLWDAATGAPIGPPMRHEDWVWSAAFSPDGTRVVTASKDGTARLWDAASGAPIGPPMRHGRTVLSAVFSPDGTRVVTASEDGTARLWDVRWPKGPITAVACALLQGDDKKDWKGLADRYGVLISDAICNTAPPAPDLSRLKPG